MGDRLIAASSAYSRAPADSSQPVLIDALPSLDRGPSGSLGEGRLHNAVETEGFPQVLVAERAVPVRLKPMAPEPTGLTARICRSCRSAGKTGGGTGRCSPLL